MTNPKASDAQFSNYSLTATASIVNTSINKHQTNLRYL